MSKYYNCFLTFSGELQDIDTQYMSVQDHL